MSIEILLGIIIVLLAGILFILILMLRNNFTAFEAIQIFIEEKESKRKSRHRDLSDFLEDKKFEELLVEVDRRLKEEPNSPPLHWYKGIATYHLKQWKLSKEIFEKAIVLEPNYKNDISSYLEVINEHIDEPDV